MDAEHLRAKTCTQCGEIKLIKELYKKKNSMYGIDTECIACHSLRSKNYHSENRESILAADAQYRVENREVLLMRGKLYRENNIEARKIKRVIYKENNREKVASLSAKYRAAKRQATVAWADPIKILAFYAESNRLTKETGTQYNVDHIVPLISDVVCGLHCEDNMQVLTLHDNASKGNKFTPGI